MKKIILKKFFIFLISFFIASGAFVFITLNNSKNVLAETDTKNVNAYLYNETLSLDGTLKEHAWYLTETLTETSGENAPNVSYGMLWDKENLYIGFIQSGAEKITLVINEKTAVINLAEKTFLTNEISAEMAINANKVEIKIPFSACSVVVDAFGKQIPISIIAENSTSQIKTKDNSSIALNGKVIYVADSCIDFASKGYTVANSGAVKGVVQGAGSYKFITDETASSIGIKRTPIFPSGDLNYSFDIKINELPLINDSFSRRGFYFDARGYLEEFGFSLSKSTDGLVYVNMLYDMWAGGDGSGWAGTSRQIATKIKEGDTINLLVAYKGKNVGDGNGYAEIYIDGQYIHTFKNINSENPQLTQFFDIYASNSNSGGGKVDVELLDYIIYKPQYKNNKALANSIFNEKIPFSVFGGNNTSVKRVMNNLTLPTSIELPVIENDVQVSWSSNRKDVLSDNGVILSSSTIGKEVKLTASVVLGGVKYSKVYDLVVSGYSKSGNVMFLEHDLDPYTGVLLEKGNTDMITFDVNLNSIGYDFGEPTLFNEILLKDADNYSRLEKEDISIFVSNDNVNYTRIKDWFFLRTEEGVIISNLEERARYVKLHCHLEDYEDAGCSGPQQEMLRVYYNEQLPGDNGGYFNALTNIRSNVFEKTDTDVVTYVSLETLEGVLDNCKNDYADVRFVSNGKLIPHYFDGNGFYLRLLEVTEGQSVQITVYGENENAISISNSEGVLDAVYGNKTVYSFKFEKFYHNIALGLMPNGDLVAIANWMSSVDNLLMIRSTDGGRTWSETYTEILDMSNPVNAGRNEGGGFILDREANDGKGRVFYIYYLVRSGQPTETHIIYTDDNGYNWSDPILVDQMVDGEKVPLSTYSDGIKLSVADGDGPNVDYCVPLATRVNSSGFFKSVVIYSKDAGMSWQTSQTLITYSGRGDEGLESGMSECAIAELSNGDIKLYGRCQYKGMYWYASSVSHDHGITWQEEADLSNVITPNTMPVLQKDQLNPDNIMFLWGGNNFMGGESYRRYPMTLAYSDDQMETWKQKLNLFTNTSFEKYGDEAYNPNGSLIVQPSMMPASYNGSDDMFVTWWNFWYGGKGILIEDMHDLLYKTKGAADEFEISSTRHEGWRPIWGDAYITKERAKNGNGSLRIDDVNLEGNMARANRAVPAITNGIMRFDLSFEQLKSGFLIELKSAYVDNSNLGNLMSLKINSNGDVKDINPANREETLLGNISLDDWINVEIHFDIPNNTAELYINGIKLGNLSVRAGYYEGDSITNVQFCDTSSASNEMIAYVDNFAIFNGIANSDWTLN